MIKVKMLQMSTDSGNLCELIVRQLKIDHQAYMDCNELLSNASENQLLETWAQMIFIESFPLFFKNFLCTF